MSNATEARERTWLKKPGECHDKRGVPIYPGDLLKSPHFYDRQSRRLRYLYHVATYQKARDDWPEAMYLTPTTWLDPGYKRCGGQCLLNDLVAADLEVVDGHGPGEILDYLDRPRKPVVARSATSETKGDTL